MEKTYDPIEEQYNEFQRAKKSLIQKKSVKFDVKNYLNTKLDQGQSEKKLTVRIIKLTPDSETPFKQIFTHYVPATKKTYICLKHTRDLPGDDKDGNCPFCDVREQAEKEQKTANDIEWKKLKDIRNQNTAQDNYVVRVIDRDDQSFGTKFWKLSSQHYDEIEDIRKNHKLEGIDIFDIKNGKDLIITIKKKDNKNKITNISAKSTTTPLSTNEDEVNSFINDTKKWHDVYGVKSYEYLTLVIKGEEPYFDKTKNMWVSKREFFAEKEEQDDEDTNVSQEYESEFTNESPVTNDSEDEDEGLPF